MGLKIKTSDQVVADICSLYWSITDTGDFLYTVTQVAEQVSLKTHQIHGLVTENSTYLSNNTFCVVCEIPYPINSRKELLEHNNSPSESWMCPSCENDIHKNININKLSVLQNEFDHRSESLLTIDDLGFQNAIYLLALIRHSADEGMYFIEPIINNHSSSFSPNQNFSSEVMNKLYRDEVISILPHEDYLEGFNENEQGGLSFNILNVPFYILFNTELYSSLNDFRSALEEKISSLDYLETDSDSVDQLMKRISIEECLEYLYLSLSERGFTFNAGEKTIGVLSKALENYSVAQVYNFIWQATKNASDFYMSKNTSKAHAANTVVGYIEKTVERAQVNDWKMKAFQRNFNIQQSTISRALFNTMLATDDGGFHKKLSSLA